MRQSAAELLGLPAALVIELNVQVALDSGVHIPIGFTVSNGYDAGEFHKKGILVKKLGLILALWGGEVKSSAARGLSLCLQLCPRMHRPTHLRTHLRMCLRWFCSLALASVAAFARHAHAFDETTPSAAALSQARSVQDRQDREREAMRPDAMALGLWVTKDDDSEVAMAWVRLSLVGDHLSGRIEKILDPQAKPDERCTLCAGDRHNQSLLGLEIIRSGRWDVQNRSWQQAFILDPENGQEYRLSLKLMDAGRTLQVRADWGIFWRQQTWTRHQTY